MFIITFLFSPIGRWLTGVLALLAILGGIYTKGRVDGHASLKAKIERQTNDAIQKGEDGRAAALKQLDAGSMSDNWWRD